ncbi:MAG: hypothetical protein CR997_11890 [Acidobacteria bacterium]|nr:MAG: hypothetical protein CR997_11890 [Acidobacteriota bacterium]
MNNKVIGIDLGTTHTLAAHYEDGALHVFNPDDPLIPSVVSYPGDNRVLVGKEALEYAKKDPENTVFSVKRFMGKGDDQLDLHHHRFPFSLHTHQGLWQVRIRERWVSPQEISAHILKQVLASLGDFSGEVQAVITVPAYFNDAQRQATRDAGKIAGLRVMRIINEPTAAALAYGLHEIKSGTVAVYDLGGGTFDFSLLKVTNGVFRVLSTHGNTFLGGDDFDEALMADMLEKKGMSMCQLNQKELHDLRIHAKTIKETLTEKEEVTELIKVGKHEMEVSYTRETFNQLIQPFVKHTLDSCQKALRDAGKRKRDISHVILVGGSSRVPLVREMLKSFFKKELFCSLNPDYVVAMGAAMQASLIHDSVQDMLLMDVTPLSIGLETVGGGVTKIIMRNTPIPAQASEKFTTYADNQTAIDFHILQGERELVEDNISLARFKLRGIPPMAAGMAVVHVDFRIDADGILTVQAKEEKSGLEAAVEVVPSHGLSMEKVKDIITQSILHAREDFDHVRLIAARTDAQTLIQATQKALQQNPDLIGDDREYLQDLVEELSKVCEGRDIAAIEEGTDKLNRETTLLAESLVSHAVLDMVEGKTIEELSKQDKE